MEPRDTVYYNLGDKQKRSTSKVKQGGGEMAQQIWATYQRLIDVFEAVFLLLSSWVPPKAQSGGRLSMPLSSAKRRTFLCRFPPYVEALSVTGTFLCRFPPQSGAVSFRPKHAAPHETKRGWEWKRKKGGRLVFCCFFLLFNVFALFFLLTVFLPCYFLLLNKDAPKKNYFKPPTKKHPAPRKNPTKR